MMTTEQIRLYQRYEGDADMLARTGSTAQKAVFSSKEWHLIEEFIANLRLESNGLLADSFKQELHRRLAAECAGIEAVELLKQAARPQPPRRSQWVVWLLILGALLLVLLLWKKNV